MTKETAVEAMKSVIVRDKHGNIIDPDKIVLDPDWVAHMENPGDAHPQEDDGAAEGREAPLG